MARQPEAKGLRDLKRTRADGGSPLNSQPRTVQNIGSSLYLNLTKYCSDTHGISRGDELRVVTYPSGIWIEVDDD